MPNILDMEGKFLVFTGIQEEVHEKINKTFPRYRGLCDTIPKYWRKVFSCDRESDLV